MTSPREVVREAKRIVIKIGSSPLVDAQGALREHVLARRVGEIAALRARAQ